MRNRRSSHSALAAVLVFLCGAMIPTVARAQAEDVTPPVIASFTFSPGTIDVSGGPQNVTVSEHLTDDLAGVAYSCFGFLSPSTLQNHGSCNSDPYQRDSGTNLDGMYHVDVSFPQYAEAGDWHVYYAFVCDLVGNCSSYSEQDLIDLGFPTVLQVQSTPDTTAPAIADFSFSPGTIDVSGGPQNVTVSEHLTDDLAGVAYSCFGFLSPSTLQNHGSCNSDPYQRDSGTNLDGMYHVDVSFPQYAEGGDWHVYYAFVCDVIGNCRSHSEQDLSILGFSTILHVVSNPADATAPAIASFSFTPNTINTSNGSHIVTVTERLTDDLAGVAYSCFGFLSPSGLQNHGSCNSSPYQRDSGDNLDGMYHVDVTFPQYGELGLWHVYYAFVCDVIGNCRNYSEQDLIALGSPTILEVTASRDITLFLHGSGGTANPPSLFLDDVSPISATAKYKDSTSINFSGGNAWKTVGSWGAASSLTGGSLTALTELRAWLGLKNSDDQGTNFDLRAEVYKNNTLVGSGETYCVQNVTRNPSYAVEVTIDLAPFSPVDFNGTSDVLTLKVLTRIGTNGAGTSCGGHGNAVGLRLYFDAASRASKFGGTF